MEIKEETKEEIQVKVGDKVVKAIKEDSFQDKVGLKMDREDLVKEDKEALLQEKFQDRSHLTMM